jgi:hypothetical protein
MLPLTSAQLLTLWEHGATRHPLDRALLLFAQAAPELAVEQLAERPLGECNAALMRLRWQSFGTRMPLWMDCPVCGERMEFELLPEQLPPMRVSSASVEVAGRRYRCPGIRDMARIASMPNLVEAAEQLLLDCGEGETPDELRPLVEAAIEEADPWADLSLAFRCPACSHEGAASLDIAAYLWEEVEASARQLFDEIHLLAQAYGWSESEILALSATRRSAYLARVVP